jgi:hypothetical protein
VGAKILATGIGFQLHAIWNFTFVSYFYHGDINFDFVSDHNLILSELFFNSHALLQGETDPMEET